MISQGLIGIIGGTGFGDELRGLLSAHETQQVDTPFGKPSGPVTIGELGRSKIAMLNRHGPGHKLGPSDIPFAANIFALKKLGVRTVISSGAVGSLRDEIQPGHLVIVDQFIDKTSKRQSTFFHNYGAVHCEFAEPTCRRLRKILHETAGQIDVETHLGGTYVCMEGPQFSTRAESLMHRGWGGDLIGMTALPEAKLAREAQMCYALVALVSDYDCWREHEADKDKKTLLQEITANLSTATENCLKLIKAVLQTEQELTYADCPCRKSLNLAVWTNPEQIKASQEDKLKVLFE